MPTVGVRFIVVCPQRDGTAQMSVVRNKVLIQWITHRGMRMSVVMRGSCARTVYQVPWLLHALQRYIATVKCRHDLSNTTLCIQLTLLAATVQLVNSSKSSHLAIPYRKTLMLRLGHCRSVCRCRSSAMVERGQRCRWLPRCSRTSALPREEKREGEKQRLRSLV
eukprot:COSAG02_NODE_398_length_23118_cov_49.968939_16_plen_165_part_00